MDIKTKDETNTKDGQAVNIHRFDSTRSIDHPLRNLALSVWYFTPVIAAHSEREWVSPFDVISEYDCLRLAGVVNALSTDHPRFSLAVNVPVSIPEISAHSVKQRVSPL